MSSFVHLHNHTHYSLLDGACTVDDLIDAAVRNEMPAVALTDHGVNFGLLEFYQKAHAAGIKPILGCEVYMAEGSRFDKTALKRDGKRRRRNYYHLILLAKDLTGYRTLNRLTSRAHTEGFYYKPRIDRELLTEFHEGLICLSACAGGVVSAHLVHENYDAAHEAASWYKDLFGDDFYLEIQNHHLQVDEPILENMPKLSKELDIPLVVTNDCHYIEKDHAVAHNVLLHIRDASKKGAELDVESKLRYGTPEFYFRSSEEMRELFADYPDALDATLQIADRCNVEIPNDLYMPNLPIPDESESETLDEYLTELTWEGIRDRYDEITPEVEERANHELDIIIRMGYSGYFLITQDFIRAARNEGVRVGPGRGSAAGSLVAYALQITDIDPIRYQLLFERFLNPDRVSMPDIDVDFADDKRDIVIDYVKNVYGEEAVSQIITFSTLSSRAVLKDVGRVLGIHHSIINDITKDIQVTFGRVQKLKDAVENNPELKWVRESTDPKIQKLIEYSLVLEGFCRAASTHAAGVVIAPGPLEDYVPLYKTPTTGLASQYTMKYLEDAGLLKMDFLGLRTLTVIENSIDLVREGRGVDIDIDEISFEDPATYEMIGRGHTRAVFQFESPPMQKYLKELKPERIDDLIAMNALYRPGPMENIPDFIERRHGRQKISYIDPQLEPILGTTYGICVYQEQIMQIAQQLGGFTLAQADTLRRAMGKKQIEYMEGMKGDFFDGCAKMEIDAPKAGEIWDMMVKFADYGFNKSHSAAYANVAYQTAWLKANYPAEFLAACMTNESSNQTKVVQLIDECRLFNIEVLPPDINQSLVNFSVDAEGRIVFGMAAIRNVGQSAVSLILEERRENGQFDSIFDFTKRLGGQQLINKRLLEHLVLAGAFDRLHPNRHQCFEAIDAAIGYGSSYAQQQSTGMDSLFAVDDGEGDSTGLPEPGLPDIEEWERADKLTREREVLDFYVSGHPLEEAELEIDAFSEMRLGELPENLNEDSVVRIGCIVNKVTTRLDSRERTFAILEIEDFTGKAEARVWNDVWKQHATKISEGAMVFLIGKPKMEGADRLNIFVNDVVPVENAIERFTKSITIRAQTSSVDRSTAEETARLFKAHQGTVQCVFKLSDEEGSHIGKWGRLTHGVEPSRDLVRQLYSIYTQSNVRLTG